MSATKKQKALFAMLAADTGFELDATKSPKAEFTRLAIFHKGWIGGDKDWNAHWLSLFEEEYFSFRRLGKSDPERPLSVVVALPCHVKSHAFKRLYKGMVAQKLDPWPRPKNVYTACSLASV
jgi:hypothetical protein